MFSLTVTFSVREKVRIYVRVNFVSSSRQRETPEPDTESRRVATAACKVNPDIKLVIISISINKVYVN